MKIKAKRGVTYECYRGYTDRMGSRVRRGQRYYVLGESLSYYAILSPSGQGDVKIVDKDKFASQFVPINPID